MTAEPAVQPTTTRAEAIRAAGEVYGAILADPERREQLRRHRASRRNVRPSEMTHAELLAAAARRRQSLDEIRGTAEHAALTGDLSIDP